MKGFPYTIPLFVIFISFNLTGCKPDGCLDRIASNYCAPCNPSKSEGCMYFSRVIFWFNQSTSDSLSKKGVKKLNFYVTGFPVKEVDPTIFWNEAPDCKETHTIKIDEIRDRTNDLETDYIIKDQKGIELFKGKIIHTAGECTHHLLGF